MYEAPFGGRNVAYPFLPDVDAISAPRHGGDYPVTLAINDERAESRFWGHPLLGPAVRLIGLVPHMVAMFVLGIMGMLWLVFLSWVPILLVGKVPETQAVMFEELIHRTSRMWAYMALLPGYPPIGIGAPGPVDVIFDLEGRKISRWWGIPIVGLLARWVALLPHVAVLTLLFVLTTLLWLVVWLPIFITGRIPNFAARIFGSYLRYSSRVMAYAFLLPVPYPPFALRR